MCSAQAAKLGVETDALQSQLDSAPKPTAVDVAECLRIPLPAAGAIVTYRVDGAVYRISKIVSIESKVHALCHYTERPVTGKRSPSFVNAFRAAAAQRIARRVFACIWRWSLPVAGRFDFSACAANLLPSPSIRVRVRLFLAAEAQANASPALSGTSARICSFLASTRRSRVSCGVT
jgi:hypothetical protein